MSSRYSNRFPIHETRAFKAAFAFYPLGRWRLRVEGVIRGLYENRRTGLSGDYHLLRSLLVWRQTSIIAYCLRAFLLRRFCSPLRSGEFSDTLHAYAGAVVTSHWHFLSRARQKEGKRQTTPRPGFPVLPIQDSSTNLYRMTSLEKSRLVQAGVASSVTSMARRISEEDLDSNPVDEKEILEYGSGGLLSRQTDIPSSDTRSQYIQSQTSPETPAEVAELISERIQ
ncbi:hypothetical protein K449DRAFT_436599 [Hypoxylon sp. EC38]|nr:hypothetical protein K449DRAFT_436599 [Hypoxylon sp. EC38]